MATFKHQRKHHRNSKVSDDNDYNDPPHKRQRRGVSVFQRQLYKRKMWVEEYEAGKDQKRRDKRKVMRGYYRALKDLDRDHKQIFGHSISTRTRKRQKKSGEYHAQKEYKTNLKYRQKDVWNEMRRPSYEQKYKQSNWDFMDRNNEDKPRYANAQYRGNGKINYNFGNKSVSQNNVQNDEYNTEDKVHRNDKQNTLRGGYRLNSYQKAAMEARGVINEREEMQRQRELKAKEKRKALQRFEQQRKRRHKILNMKNKRGQPNLNAQMSLLLAKIKNNQKKSTEKHLNDSDIEQKQHSQNTVSQHFDHDSDHSDVEINEFLED